MLTIIAAPIVGAIILGLCITQERASDQEVRYQLDYSRIIRGSQK
jgi:hypothetical protein